MRLIKEIMAEDFFLVSRDEDIISMRRILYFLAPLIFYIVFWDLNVLHAKVDMSYVIIKSMVFLFIFISIRSTYKKKFLSESIYLLFVFMFIYSYYGMLKIHFTYCYSFWELYFVMSFFIRISKKAYISLLIFGMVLNFHALAIVAEPDFIKAGFSFKPHMNIVTMIFALLSSLLYFIVTKKKEELFILQDKFAQIGKQSSYVFHEIKKPINRLIKMNPSFKEDIVKISNIILNVELMLNNPEAFKSSFEIFDICIIYEELGNEFKDYLSQYDISFICPNKSVYINGNRGLLYQVFKNLLINSIEAIINNHEKAERSEIEIVHSYFENKVLIVYFKNNNSSIDFKIKNTIFEPFITSKEKSTNYGLGLSFCKNIINGHDGSINLQEHKNNVVFEIVFPIQQ